MRAEPAPLSAADTLSERAAARVEADILSGALPPDSRLGIAETAARYGVGATPLREALSRLAARGLQQVDDGHRHLGPPEQAARLEPPLPGDEPALGRHDDRVE